MLNVMQHLLVWLGSALGLLIVIVLWAVIIFVAVDTARAIIRDFRTDDTNDSY
jgi:hypothetical protein